MSSEKIKEQANNALTELEEAVYQTVLNFNYVHRCFTEDFCHELELRADDDIEIVRHILNKLKAKGLVENLKGDNMVNENAWHPSNSAKAREKAKAKAENFVGRITP